MFCRLWINPSIKLLCFLLGHQILVSMAQIPSTESSATLWNTTEFEEETSYLTEIINLHSGITPVYEESLTTTNPSGRNHKSVIVVNNTTTIWPVQHAAVVEGDVILGGLMMVHSREDTITCGPIMPQGGIQALEAMLYTLDQINNQQLLPNITLGAHILDDCDKDTYGLEMAVDFIKGQ